MEKQILRNNKQKILRNGRRWEMLAILGAKCVCGEARDPALRIFQHGMLGTELGRQTKDLWKDVLRYRGEKYRVICANCTAVEFIALQEKGQEP
jgi:hypothetical protein